MTTHKCTLAEVRKNLPALWSLREEPGMQHLAQFHVSQVIQQTQKDRDTPLPTLKKKQLRTRARRRRNCGKALTRPILQHEVAPLSTRDGPQWTPRREYGLPPV